VTVRQSHIGTKTRVDVDALAVRCRNWHGWGPEDELGTLNYVTAERLDAATSTVQSGRMISLAIPLDENGPCRTVRAGRFNPQHDMLMTGTDAAAGHYRGVELDYADDMIVMPLQCATQWDALSHIFHNGKMWNGLDMTLVGSAGAERDSIVSASSRLVGRDVLLDVAKHRGVRSLSADDIIFTAELEEVLAEQSVDVLPGDFVLIRTGWLEARRELAREGYARRPGWPSRPRNCFTSVRWLRSPATTPRWKSGLPRLKTRTYHVIRWSFPTWGCQSVSSSTSASCQPPACRRDATSSCSRREDSPSLAPWEPPPIPWRSSSRMRPNGR
jgi:hypothetical protein